MWFCGTLHYIAKVGFSPKALPPQPLGDGMPGMFHWEWLLSCPWRRSLYVWFVWMARVQKASSYHDLHNDRSTSPPIASSLLLTKRLSLYVDSLISSFILWQRLLFSCAVFQSEADFWAQSSWWCHVHWGVVVHRFCLQGVPAQWHAFFVPFLPLWYCFSCFYSLTLKPQCKDDLSVLSLLLYSCLILCGDFSCAFLSA